MVVLMKGSPLKPHCSSQLRVLPNTSCSPVLPQTRSPLPRMPLLRWAISKKVLNAPSWALQSPSPLLCLPISSLCSQCSFVQTFICPASKTPLNTGPRYFWKQDGSGNVNQLLLLPSLTYCCDIVKVYLIFFFPRSSAAEKHVIKCKTLTKHLSCQACVMYSVSVIFNVFTDDLEERVCYQQWSSGKMPNQKMFQTAAQEMDLSAAGELGEAQKDAVQGGERLRREQKV